MNWVDGIVLAVLIVSTLKGYLQGFVTAFISIVAFFASVIAARLYFIDLAQYLTENTALYQKIYTAVLGGLQESSPLFGGALSGERELPEAFESIVPDLGAASMVQGSALAGAAQAVSGIIINLVSAMLIFLAVRTAFAILTTLLNSLVRLPMLKQFNILGVLPWGL